MKILNYFLVGFLAFSMFACQSIDDPETQNPEADINGNNSADWELYNANWELSYAPTDMEYKNIEDQSVEIDFSLDEIMQGAISYRSSYYRDNGQVFEGDLFDTFSTFDKLAEFYERSMLGYQFIYSSFWDPFGGDAVYPAIEYALAQECFRDDCPSEIRKAVLRMALNKYERKIRSPYLSSSATRRTGMFLISVILVKEGDAAFLAAVDENHNIQNTLKLNLDTESRLNILIGTEIDSIVCQLADNFLSVNN